MSAQPLVLQCLSWFGGGWPRRVMVLLVFLLASSVGVILVSHETRALYSRIQVEEHVSDNLDSEYERLLLEQSAWAGYNRVDQLAREELHMQTPRQANLVLMRRSPRLLQTASVDGDQE
ncbi:MAG: cell division protein FtsL [Pseudomonadales bacterium]|nr:cell division protein FtsL [Pseudomonadales bacterium]